MNIWLQEMNRKKGLGVMECSVLYEVEINVGLWRDPCRLGAVIAGDRRS